MARPLPAIDTKIIIKKLKLEWNRWINKNYFTLDNLSKYGHITLKLVGRYFYLVVTIFSKKNRAIQVQKLWEEKSCQNPFSAILRLKKNKEKFRWTLSSGGGALMAWPLVEDFFSRFPNAITNEYSWSEITARFIM